MQPWLNAATISAFTTFLLLQAAFIAVYRQKRDAFTGLWAAGWAFFTIRALWAVLLAYQPISPLPAIAAQECGAIGALLLFLAGRTLVSERNYPWHAALAASLITLWIVPANLIGGNDVWSSLPPFLFCGAGLLFTAAQLHRYSKKHSHTGGRIAALSLTVWAVSGFDFFLFRPATLVAALFSTIAGLAAFLAGGAILLLLFEQYAKRWQGTAQRYTDLYMQAPPPAHHPPGRRRPAGQDS